MTGRVCYMAPVGRGVQHDTEQIRIFTCCVGSAMESHAAARDGIYYDPGQALGEPYALPRRSGKSAGVKVRVTTDLPLDNGERQRQPQIVGKVHAALRRPFWAQNRISVKVNAV